MSQISRDIVKGRAAAEASIDKMVPTWPEAGAVKEERVAPLANETKQNQAVSALVRVVGQ